jgi:hypothetical protein
MSAGSDGASLYAGKKTLSDAGVPVSANQVM